MPKKKSLLDRLDQDRLTIALARLIGYIGFPVREMAERIRSLVSLYGVKDLSAALFEIATFFGHRVMLSERPAKPVPVRGGDAQKRRRGRTKKRSGTEGSFPLGLHGRAGPPTSHLFTAGLPDRVLGYLHPAPRTQGMASYEAVHLLLGEIQWRNAATRRRPT
jgi:hypothetical protein